MGHMDTVRLQRVSDGVKRCAEHAFGFRDVIRVDSAMAKKEKIHHRPWLPKEIRMRAGMLVHDCLGSRTDLSEMMSRDAASDW